MGIEPLKLKYYYGTEAESFNFFRIPKLLFTDKRFADVSVEAKVLYGLMLDRMGLSIKNGWHDKENRVFIYFTLEEIMESLNCAHTKATKLLVELDVQNGIGLIERKKQGQGKPTIIYVKRFANTNIERNDEKAKKEMTAERKKSNIRTDINLEVENSVENEKVMISNNINTENNDNIQDNINFECLDNRMLGLELEKNLNMEVLNNEMRNSRLLKNESQECTKSATNNTNINNTNINNTDISDTQSINQSKELEINCNAENDGWIEFSVRSLDLSQDELKPLECKEMIQSIDYDTGKDKNT